MDKDKWQNCGGMLNIPEGWFVYRVDLDFHEPYCIIADSQKSDAEKKRLAIPKPLAYFLSTHFCGSDNMKRAIQKETIKDVRNKLKNVLFWDD